MVAAGKVRYVLIGSSGGLGRVMGAPGAAIPGGAVPGTTDGAPGPPAQIDYGQSGGPLPGAYQSNAGAGPQGRGSARAIEQYVLKIGTAISADEYGGGSGGGTLYYMGD